ncbi:Glyoxalase-like domain protein [Vibrio spartinae]|uniref:Bleomycin resistance protein n=2 Tax=Vibrio spartinae TaxID=1918945 RepID=A0ABX6R019_9VIBR|nr:Glyoxalase-like domain protein [Vibrio spartinae]
MVPELSVSNFEESFNFYQNLLGFKVRNRRSNPDFAYLENEKVQVMLEQIHDAGWVTGEMEYPLGRGVNFQMELTDISPILERLNAANVLSGQREFSVQDPDGYLLRFTQYLGEKSK